MVSREPLTWYGVSGVSLRISNRFIAVKFTELAMEPSGQVVLIGRIKFVSAILSLALDVADYYLTIFRSHPNVGAKHYPQLFGKLFPGGIPTEFQRGVNV